MGMDVYGTKPTAPTGEYFRNNVWWWRPLADYCCMVAPALTAKCRHWHSNDGDGLNARDSRRLADALRDEITSGRTAAYAAIREAEQNALPDEPCTLCAGTGIRTDAVGVQMGQPEKRIGDEAEQTPDHPRYGQIGWCNGCDGRGHKRPAETWYPFSVENVEEWITFLNTCGGFKIW